MLPRQVEPVGDLVEAGHVMPAERRLPLPAPVRGPGGRQLQRHRGLQHGAEQAALGPDDHHDRPGEAGQLGHLGGVTRGEVVRQRRERPQRRA